LLHQFDCALKAGRGPILEKKPYGGAHLIFFGDFSQFQPTVDCALFKKPTMPDNWNPRPGQSPKWPGLQGYEVFSQLTHTVLFEKQHRQSDTESGRDFHRFLGELRFGRCSAEDFEKLCDRVIDNNPTNSHLARTKFRFAPVITSRNMVRDQLNNAWVLGCAKQRHLRTTVLVADDKLAHNAVLAPGRRLELLNKCNASRPGLLPYFDGIQYVCKHNIATELGIFNGSVCYGVGLADRDQKTGDGPPLFVRPGPTAPEFILCYFPDGKMQQPLPGLPLNVVPVRRESNVFEFRRRRAASTRSYKQSYTRKQFPLTPCKGITSHASQGKTIPLGILDLMPASGAKRLISDVYVPLSRFSCWEDFLLLRRPPIQCLLYPVPPELERFCIRLEILHKTTAQAANLKTRPVK
jgi:hypothetical protein